MPSTHDLCTHPCLLIMLFIFKFLPRLNGIDDESIDRHVLRNLEHVKTFMSDASVANFLISGGGFCKRIA